jgi:hypothetical protein
VENYYVQARILLENHVNIISTKSVLLLLEAGSQLNTTHNLTGKWESLMFDVLMSQTLNDNWKNNKILKGGTFATSDIVAGETLNGSSTRQKK